MFNHTYLICSMEPELYDYENDQKEDYSQDEWYYQNPLSNKEEEEEEYDMNEYDDDYYTPEREI